MVDAGVTSGGPRFSPAVRSALVSVIGLDPEDGDPLHVKLGETIERLGQGATFGQRVVALRFVFAWELREAGEEYARAKVAYEHAVSRSVTEQAARASLDGVKFVLGLAERVAESEAYELKLRYLLAEQKERAMRKFLEALEAALENHRTDRADQRAGDRASAQGYGGGA